MAVANEHRSAVMRTVGIGFAPAVLLLPHLPEAGLTGLAFLALGALIVGVPTANAAWRAPAVRGEGAAVLTSASSSLAALVGVLLLSLALGPIAAEGAAGVALCVGCWVAAALLANRPVGGLAAVAAGLALLALGAGLSFQMAPPWTLLEPHWERSANVAGPALAAGVLAAGGGAGHFTFAAPRPPGNRHAPWVVAGIALIGVVFLALIEGARYEAMVGKALPSLPLLVATTLVLTAGAAAFCGGARDARSGVARAAIGLLTTLALAYGGPAPAAFLAATLLPACAIGVLGIAALGTSGGDRLWLAIGMAVLTAGVVMGWPGWPSGALDAVNIGLVAVFAFWFVATRSLKASVLEGRAA